MRKPRVSLEGYVSEPLPMCACGAAPIAVRPGHAGDAALDLFAVTRWEAALGWCLEHWPAAFLVVADAR